MHLQGFYPDIKLDVLQNNQLLLSYVNFPYLAPKLYTRIHKNRFVFTEALTQYDLRNLIQTEIWKYKEVLAVQI